MKKNIFKIFTLFILLALLILVNVSASNVYTTNLIPDRVNMLYYDGTANSRGFNWATNSKIEKNFLQIIKINKDQDLDKINWDDSIKVEATKEDVYPGYRTWKAHVLNLEFKSDYAYRLGCDLENKALWTKTEKIYIDDGSDGVSFLHITDQQGRSEEDFKKSQKTVNSAIKKFGYPTGILGTGDFTQEYKYPDANILEWGRSLNSLKDVLNKVVLTPTPGNHDKFTNFFKAHFNTNTASNKKTTTGFFFSYTIGDVHVTSINTNEELTFASPLSKEQLDWIENDLATTKAKWKILMTHKGFYSTGRHALEDDTNLLRRDVLPLISKYHVDLVLQGHDHTYARTNPYLWDSDGFTVNNNYETVTKIENNFYFDYAINPGTYFVCPNTAAGDSINLSPIVDTRLLPKYYSIARSKINNNECNQQTFKPFYGYITIKGDKLLYRSYEVDREGVSHLYDYFAITKTTTNDIDLSIKNLPDKFTSNLRSDVANILLKLNLLSEDEKAKISSSSILKINEFSKYVNVEDYIKSKSTVKLINNLKPISDLDFAKKEIDNAFTSYNSLSNIQKAYVLNIKKLKDLQKELDDRLAAKKVDTKIEEITDSNMKEVRESYDKLSNIQKSYVSKYHELAKKEAEKGIYNKQK